MVVATENDSLLLCPSWVLNLSASNLLLNIISLNYDLFHDCHILLSVHQFVLRFWWLDQRQVKLLPGLISSTVCYEVTSRLHPLLDNSGVVKLIFIIQYSWLVNKLIRISLIITSFILESHTVASLVLHLLLILQNNLTLSRRNNLLRHLWNFIRNSFVTSLPGRDHPKLWWLIKDWIDFVSKSLKLRASLSCWRWLLYHLEIAFILRMDLLSLSLNHIDIVVSCRLSLTIIVPFWSRHFLYRVKRSCGFITSLVSLLLRLKSFLVLFDRRYLM